jgi:nucleotide-binding universal stress UspA family protein
MYSKILVPLDGSKTSEQILPYARYFADAHGIPVELLRITDPELRPPFWPTETDDQYLRRIAAEYFSGAATSAAEVGAPGRVIVDYAKRDSSCLIAMATHGMSGARRWLFGSVTSKVIQTAANSLLLIRPGDHADALTHVSMDKIFVPLDGSGLAEKTLPHACALAKRLSLEMHLLRVYTLPLNAYIVADGMIAQGPAQLREELAREAQAYLDGKVAALSAMGFERVVAIVLQGDPASEIIDLTRKTPNSLVAMSTHGRSGIGRWVLGSVAERVVQHSQDPVLLIRAK